MPTWIKFCGTTCLEDALASIDAGADALGFIFARSKRQVSPEKAGEISAQIPAEVERIGVFADATADVIMATVREARLTAVQLHGNESPELVFGLHDQIGVIKSILVRPDFTEQLDKFLGRRESPDHVLLDSGAGSGQTFDWRHARAQLGPRKVKPIIAGGLSPKNVGKAIEIFSPWGVDVVSGIESEPGRKDPVKMRAFVTAVRKAEQK